MEVLGNISQWAGVLALAAFSGTLLGGITLSFFWKNFGPWKLLEACRAECQKCHEEREADQKQKSRLESAYADLNARYAVVMLAVERGGLGLQLAPLPTTKPITSSTDAAIKSAFPHLNNPTGDK